MTKNQILPSVWSRLLNSAKKTFWNPFPNVALEIGNTCQVRCTWCLMYQIPGKDSGLMKLDDFKHWTDMNKAYLKYSRTWVYPQHRGESLLNPSFLDMVDYGAARGILWNTLHTNLSIKLDVKRFMDCAIPSIIVNVGGTSRDVHEKVMKFSSFEMVTENLRMILRSNIHRKIIVLKMNVTKDNFHQISELPAFFKDLGGDPRNVLAGRLEFINSTQATPEQREEFLKNTVSSDIKDYMLFEVDRDRGIQTKVPECQYMTPSIRWDGKMSFCCQDKFGHFDMGNAFEKPLKDILRTEDFKAAVAKGYRREHKICEGCN